MDGLLSATSLTPASVSSGMLPTQDQYRAQILIDRWIRDANALQQWAPLAKKCVQFNEGEQWDEEDEAELQRLERPKVTRNKINRLFRLVYGYYTQNRTDVSYAPSDDALSTAQVAEIMTKLYMQETGRNDTIYEDGQVFQDGIVTGRGFWDIRMNFERTDLGETVARAIDPFAVYLQHDAMEYDLQQHHRISTSRWCSIDDIGATYGEQAAQAVMAAVGGQGWYSFPQNYYWDIGLEETPKRRFDSETGDTNFEPWWSARQSYIIDPHMRNVRVVDMQYKVRTRAACFVDLETGDWSRIPDEWGEDKIAKALYHGERLKNPLKVVQRVINRHRWTTMVGDIMLWDDWSPYDWFTIVPFFPYFRRGQTRGMVHDLIDPQRNINKRESLETEILGRTANGGWIIHEQAMSEPQRELWKKWSSTPGFVGEWSGREPWMKPERLDSQPRNLAVQVNKEQAAQDLFEISGVNESAAGDLDRVQSGKAIMARQRQAVVGTRLYHDNWGRSLKLKGRTYCSNFQRFYTEERIIREVGEPGRIGQYIINQRILSPDGMSVVSRINDITMGRYSVVVKETPTADTFEQAQFEEMLMIFEKLGDIGKQVAMVNPGLIIEMSTLPRKPEWMQAIQQAVAIQSAQMQAQQAQEQGQPSPGQPQPPGQSGPLTSYGPHQMSEQGRVIPAPAAAMQPPQPPQPPQSPMVTQGAAQGVQFP